MLKGQLPPRPALDAYLVDRYREFVSGLLDVTDNLVDGKVVHPPEVVRHDDDDPYLVVAADKGTAHLSDTANSGLGAIRLLARRRVRLRRQQRLRPQEGRHHRARRLGVRRAPLPHPGRRTCRREPFTVAGIGDMAGDVFGNGMLRSRTTRLVAAFNHQHIFLDPDPDAERSLRRARAALRAAALDVGATTTRRRSAPAAASSSDPPRRFRSARRRARCSTSQAEAPSGEEVIRHILTMKVDLLYNGGIGTYVKASGEDNAEVGDRANDRVRVDAAERSRPRRSARAATSA